MRAALATLIALVILGCSSREASTELEARPPPSAPEPEVVAPAGLLAELRVEHPAAAWRRLRTWGAQSTRVVPGSFSLAVATVAGLPPLAAASVDEDAPLVGAVLERQSRAVLVVGVRVRSGRELRAQLTAGSNPPFDGRLHGRTVVLVPRSGVRGSAASAHASGEIALGIHGEHLLLGTDERAIARAGGFVDALARRRSASPAVATVPRAALSGPMSRALRHWWSTLRAHLEASDAEQRARHGGRAPDFGDPTAVLVGISALVDDGLAILESTEEVRVFADLFAVPPRVRVELEPLATGRARQAIVSLAALDLKPLLDLPANTAFAALVSALPDAEVVSTRAAEVLGDRIGAAERRRMTDALQNVRSALGGPVVSGWISAGETGSAFLRAPLKDKVAFNAAVRQGVRLLSAPARRAATANKIGRLVVSRGSAEFSGERWSRLRVRARSARRTRQPPFEVLWKDRGDELVIVAGTGDLGPVILEVEAPGATLSSWPGLVEPAARQAGKVAAAGVMRVNVGGALGWALVAAGRAGNSAWLEVNLSEPLAASLTALLFE